LAGSISIVEAGKNLWHVTAAFSPKYNTKDAIPLKLREIKREISRRFQHPETLLRYRQLMKRQILDDGNIYIEIEIERLSTPAGPINVILEPMMSDTGEEYHDMSCKIDLFPADEDDSPISIDTVQSILSQKSIQHRFLQQKILRDSIRNILANQVPMHNIEIARGLLPSKGEDARLEFKFPTRPQRGMTNEYVQSRKVKCGDILCVKSPPTTGKSSGITVQGQKLPPRKGWDVRMAAEHGTSLTQDHTQIVAQINGLVTAARKEKSILLPEGRRIIPVEISFRVEPLWVVSGKQREVLTIDDPIEVAGSLSVNSHLISRNLVHVRGNVLRGSKIEASRDITIGGNIDHGSLTSDGSIMSDGVVRNSTVTAKGNVSLVGPVIESEISGSDIDLGNVQGSFIQAQRRVAVEVIGASAEGRLSKVNIGKNSYLKEKIRQNESFTKSAMKNLKRLYKLFDLDGEDKLEPSDLARVLMRLLNKRIVETKKPYSAKEVKALKQLLGSVLTLKALIAEKTEEVKSLEQQLTETDDSKKLLVVKERVTARTIVMMGDYKTELEPTDYGICVTSDNQGISVESLPDDLESIEELLSAFEDDQLEVGSSTNAVPDPTIEQ
jgi:uncharacterized protein (DUF342 family)